MINRLRHLYVLSPIYFFVVFTDYDLGCCCPILYGFLCEFDNFFVTKRYSCVVTHLLYIGAFKKPPYGLLAVGEPLRLGDGGGPRSFNNGGYWGFCVALAATLYLRCFYSGLLKCYLIGGY